MTRTRKWIFVAQEAKRLAALKLTPREIAERLEVSKSTVTRWMASGRLVTTAESPPVEPAVSGALTPDEWVTAVQAAYSLDVTDEQLVRLAADALMLSKDLQVTPQIRLQAAGRFQGIVKQLRLVARTAPVESPVQAPKTPLRVIRRPTSDPRRALMAVSE